MSVLFKRVEVTDERELEDLIIKSLDQLEERLKVVDHQVQTDSGPLDILCVDRNNALTIIEEKLDDADSWALAQALRYYDWVFENRAALAKFYPNSEIDIQARPRIILVAKSFSEDLMTVAKYVWTPIDLRTYVYLETRTGDKGLYFNPVEISPLRAPPPAPTTVDDHINWITNENVRNVCKEVVQEITKIGDDIELNPTMYYLALSFRGRNFTVIQTRRSYFYIYKADWSESVLIEKRGDFTPEWFSKIKEYFVEIGGKLKEKETEK